MLSNEVSFNQIFKINEKVIYFVEIKRISLIFLNFESKNAIFNQELKSSIPTLPTFFRELCGPI